MTTDSRCAGAIPCYLNDNGECVATDEWMCTRPQWTHEHPLRVVTLCSGYDSQCLALDALKEHYPSFDYDLVAWAEFDPASKQPIEKQPAVKAHNALFPQWADRNLGDITKIDWAQLDIECDLLFYSTPCQSISSAGLQHGFAEGSGTRSSIIWNVRDAIIHLRPKYLILENVKDMVSRKFIPTFNLWQLELERLGYVNHANILNALNYGIPQNRQRLFLISIRMDGLEAFDGGCQYNWPRPFPLKRVLKDMLEDKVDDKFYLSDASIERLTRNLVKCGREELTRDVGGAARTVCNNSWRITTFDNYIGDD